MSTLDSIFSDDSERITGVGVRADHGGDASRLVALIGAVTDDAVVVTEGHDLARMVGLGADDGIHAQPMESGPQLSELVGSIEGVPEPTQETSSALASMINDDVLQGEVNPALHSVALAGSRASRRSREGQRDWASAAVAVVAVVAVVGVAGATVATRISTSPSDRALVSLTQQEADLRNREQTLAGTLDRLEATREDEQSLAADAAVALRALEDKSDPMARSAAVTALDEYVDTLAMPSRVSPPEQYTRLDLGDGQLSQVARALDDVREADVAVQDVVREARELLNARTAAQQDFLFALTTFGGTIPSSANGILAENSAAAEPFRIAVTSLVTAINNDQRTGGSGLDAMLAYAAAVDALRADNQRAVEEKELANAIVPVVRNPGGGFTPTTPGIPPAPPTTDPQPTDPPVDPEPTDPPVDPEPTEPPVDPEPTEPPVDPAPPEDPVTP